MKQGLTYSTGTFNMRRYNFTFYSFTKSNSYIQNDSATKKLESNKYRKGFKGRCSVYHSAIFNLPPSVGSTNMLAVLHNRPAYIKSQISKQAPLLETWKSVFLLGYKVHHFIPVHTCVWVCHALLGQVTENFYLAIFLAHITHTPSILTALAQAVELSRVNRDCWRVILFGAYEFWAMSNSKIRTSFRV